MNNVTPISPGTTEPEQDLSYWHALISERKAGEYLGFAPRTMQDRRYKGTGPQFVRLSSRTVRYRRADLKAWADSQVRTSTAQAA